MSIFLYRLGRACFRHFRRVFAAWIFAIAALGVMAGTIGAGTENSFEIPGTESQDALHALGRTFPELSGAAAYLIAVAPDGESMTSQDAKRRIDTVVEQAKKVPDVAEVISPYDELNPVGLNSDNSAAMVQVQFSKQLTELTAEQLDQLKATAEPLRAAGYTAQYGGDAFTNTGPALSITEALGVVLAFGVLWLTFRSLLTAFLPIVTALAGVGATMALTFAATGLLTISPTAPLLALMIGLAVGIDYSLFILSRHTEEMRLGVDSEEAASRAVATAGSAVVFAGVTVMIALLGLAIARIPFLTIMGVFAAIAVAVAVLVALTLLPAFIGLLGGRIRPHRTKGLARRLPVLRRLPEDFRFSRWFVRGIIRIPVLTVAIVVVGLGVLSIPAKDLSLALPDNGTEPAETSHRKAYDLIDEEFGPGFNGPLLVMADIITSMDPLGDVASLEKDVRATDGIETIGVATPNRTGDTAIIQVVPKTGPSSQGTKQLVADLRDAAPKWENKYGFPISVTGFTAASIDVSDRLGEALLPFGLVVVGLSVLLLAAVFRSILVPLKATAGYLLSVGVSFGAVVAVFEWGWFGGLIGIDETGPVLSFLPIILMGVLFGLAMDYEVFLVSRMKEDFAHTGDPEHSIETGFMGSSKVVTAAAVIMLAVFAAFVPQGDATIKPMAFALTIGVFVDAFIVRMVLVPAVLKLFGQAAWALPRWLDKVLPSFDVEGDELRDHLAQEEWHPDSTAVVLTEDLRISGTPIAGLNISVNRGDWLLVHGPAQAAKTSLLLALAGRMPIAGGRARVAGYSPLHEPDKVRRRVALADVSRVNDLDDALTIGEQISEQLATESFRFWAYGRRGREVLASLNQVLGHVYGRPTQLPSNYPVADLDRLQRKILAVALALISSPQVLIVDDVDDIRGGEDIEKFWRALDFMTEDTEITVLASVQQLTEGPAQRPVHTLALSAPQKELVIV